MGRCISPGVILCQPRTLRAQVPRPDLGPSTLMLSFCRRQGGWGTIVVGDTYLPDLKDVLNDLNHNQHVNDDFVSAVFLQAGIAVNKMDHPPLEVY